MDRWLQAAPSKGTATWICVWLFPMTGNPVTRKPFKRMLLFGIYPFQKTSSSATGVILKGSAAGRVRLSGKSRKPDGSFLSVDERGNPSLAEQSRGGLESRGRGTGSQRAGPSFPGNHPSLPRLNDKAPSPMPQAPSALPPSCLILICKMRLNYGNSQKNRCR